MKVIILAFTISSLFMGIFFLAYHANGQHGLLKDRGALKHHS